MKIRQKDLLVLIITSVLIFLLTCPAFPSTQEKGEGEGPIIYFGLIPLYTPQTMYERFQPLMDYLSANTPYRFKMRLAKDYKDIVTLLKDGSIDIALLGGVSYTIAKNRVDLLPLLEPLNRDGKPFYRGVIITRKDKEIYNLSDLKGRSIAFASRWSTSGAVVPLYYLYTNRIGLQSLSSYFHLRYHDSVVREVLKGNYDAGAVMDTIVSSYKDKGLKVVFVSDPVPELIIVARKKTPGELVKAVKKAILDLHAGNPMLKDWGDEIRYGFAEAKDSDYDGIRKMIEYLKRKGVYLRDDED